MVRAAISAALVEHCGARFTIDWDDADAVVDPSGNRVDVRALLDDATDSGSADELLRVLEDEGVPLSFSVSPAEVEAEQLASREPVVHSVVTCVARRRTMRVLVVADNALIVKRLGMFEGFGASLRHRATDAYAKAMLHVASIPLPQLLEDRRAEVFPWDRVGSAVLRKRRLTVVLNGRRRRLKVKKTAIAGDFVGSLRQHLGERFAVVV
jgi:hypothetical protein